MFFEIHERQTLSEIEMKILTRVFSNEDAREVVLELKNKITQQEWLNMLGDFAQKRLTRIEKYEAKIAAEAEAHRKFKEKFCMPDKPVVLAGDLYVELINRIGDKETHERVEQFLKFELDRNPVKENRTQHVHAFHMAEYAQDAMHHMNPWVNWEFSNGETNHKWVALTGTPTWALGARYRRKDPMALVWG